MPFSGYVPIHETISSVLDRKVEHGVNVKGGVEARGESKEILRDSERYTREKKDMNGRRRAQTRTKNDNADVLNSDE